MNNNIIYEKTNPIARGLSTMQPHVGQNMDFLNDRNVFNKTTNNQSEQMDLSALKPSDYEQGMPLHGFYVRNNKKSLINNPYINENNGGSGNFATDETIENSMSNNYSSIASTQQINDFALCPIERELILHRFEQESKKGSRHNILGITFSVNSTFGETTMWKTLILLSKEPYPQQLKFMIGDNKNEKLNDMKNTASYFDELGTITVTIPMLNDVVNTNMIQKIKQVYGTKIVIEKAQSNVIQMNLKYNFLLKIPMLYSPTETRTQLMGIGDVIKTITLTNVLCSMEKYYDLFCVEIQFGENMILGFAYTMDLGIIDMVPVEYVLNKKPFNYVVKKMVIPKLNKVKRGFIELVENVHLGELCYGKMYNVMLNSDVTFNMGVCDENFEVKGNVIGEVVINHPCFYYVKNGFVQNKLLVSGLLNYHRK